ncbi:hypothetical protein L227DRAFT_470790, partial [Lentinus tigrinus ALCF2SS1-6]
LTENAAIISGSVALQFFMSDPHWNPRDLDIYVANANWRNFVRAITDPSGLNFLPLLVPPPPTDSDKPGPSTSPNPVIQTFYTPNGRRVDVIRSPSNNPITPIWFFWSTHLMNFITPTACVSGFHSATLLRQGALKA